MKSMNLNKAVCMRLVLALAAVALAVTMAPGRTVAAGQAEGVLEISLADYVAAYVANSDEVATARENAENAETQWQRAVAEKQARLTIEELENTAYTRKLALQETVNNVVIKAVQAYVDLDQAMRDLAAKRVALNVAEERLRVTRLRYEAGLTTRDSVLQQENSYISATDALVKAEINIKQVKESFCEAAGLESADTIALTTDVSSLYTGEVEFARDEVLEAARKASSSYFSAAAAADIARRKHEALKDPMIATKNERDQAAKADSDAQARLSDAEKSLVSSVDNALATLESLMRSLEMQTISAELAAADLEVARIRFDHGEMLQYELDSQVSSAEQAQFRAVQAKIDLFLQVLRIVALTGGDAMGLITR